MTPPETPLCPVCRARFRQETTCPRCGADLTVLMQLTGRSYLARRAARSALRSGDLDQARALSAQAQQLRDTTPGRSLLTFTTWMQHILTDLSTLRRP